MHQTTQDPLLRSSPGDDGRQTVDAWHRSMAET